jgi:hypothetical protein
VDTTGIKHLFTGVEAEGMWKGFPTVFITQDYLLATSLVAQIDLLTKREEPHVYLGASGRHLTPGDWPHVRALLDKLPNKLFTVETDLDERHRQQRVPRRLSTQRQQRRGEARSRASRRHLQPPSTGR